MNNPTPDEIDGQRDEDLHHDPDRLREQAAQHLVDIQVGQPAHGLGEVGLLDAVGNDQRRSLIGGRKERQNRAVSKFMFVSHTVYSAK